MADDAGIFLHQFPLKIDVFAHRKVLIFIKLTVRMPVTHQVWMNADLEMENVILVYLNEPIFKAMIRSLFTIHYRPGIGDIGSSQCCCRPDSSP